MMLAETAITILQSLDYQVHARDFGLVNLYNQDLKRSLRVEGTFITTNNGKPVCNVFGMKERQFIKQIKALK